MDIADDAMQIGPARLPSAEKNSWGRTGFQTVVMVVHMAVVAVHMAAVVSASMLVGVILAARRTAHNQRQFGLVLSLVVLGLRGR